MTKNKGLLNKGWIYHFRYNKRKKEFRYTISNLGCSSFKRGYSLNRFKGIKIMLKDLFHINNI